MSCGCGCNDTPIITSQKGEQGIQGYAGWSPLLTIENDSERRVLKIAGWTGGSGNQPGFIGQYIGATEIVADISNAVDIRGATGATGSEGSAGNDGWSPVFAVVSDSDRRVLQIVDWQGGEGPKPSTTNQFIGSVGIVSTAGAAVDIRGPQGIQGDPGDDSGVPDPTGQDGKFLTVASDVYVLTDIIQVPSVTNNTRRILREKNAGTGPEWYTTISEYKSIPFQATGYFSSITSYVTFRNASTAGAATVFLNVTLPNDSTIRRLLFKVSLNFSSLSPDGNNSFVYMSLINTTSATTLVENIAETAYRKFYAFEYMANITCTGQTIEVQMKHDAGQNAGSFLGGFFSMIELV